MYVSHNTDVKVVDAEVAQQHAAPRQAEPLNFATYRANIEPIFLKLRENGLRCYNCHSALATRLRLEPFSSGSSSWSEEQSHKNFEFVRQLVTPGDPSWSPLLLHPLAPEAGGDPMHTGGKFRRSRSDPEWQISPNGLAWPSRDRPERMHISRQGTLSISNLSKPRFSLFS